MIKKIQAVRSAVEARNLENRLKATEVATIRWTLATVYNDS